jgi:hypothetical protein
VPLPSTTKLQSLATPLFYFIEISSCTTSFLQPRTDTPYSQRSSPTRSNFQSLAVSVGRTKDASGEAADMGSRAGDLETDDFESGGGGGRTNGRGEIGDRGTAVDVGTNTLSGNAGSGLRFNRTDGPAVQPLPSSDETEIITNS